MNVGGGSTGPLKPGRTTADGYTGTNQYTSTTTPGVRLGTEKGQ